MDKKIQKKKWTTKRIAGYSAAVLVILLVVYQLLFADNRSTLNVQKDRITIADVSYGTFQEFIPVTGEIEPGQTFYLDAIQGGIIRHIVRESGAMVDKGDTILEMANSDLQLEVMQRETQLYEQINNSRQTRLMLDENNLSQQGQLAEIDYQLGLLRPQYKRYKELYAKNLVSDREFEKVKEEYDYNIKRRKLTYASYRNDSISRAIQLHQLKLSEDRMQRSLEAVSHILDNLIITAPINGQLSSPQLEVGQSVNPGQRLGQVDVMDNYKVRVGVDELYLPRINKGQKGTFEFDNKQYELVIDKIYPTISNGQFEVDMRFAGEVPVGAKRGQTVRIRLELGNSKKALLLPVGGFYSDTGGNWVYVLNADGNTASKKEIKLGMKNPDYYEVLGGLEAGDRVIISSYENFGDNEILDLK